MSMTPPPHRPFIVDLKNLTRHLTHGHGHGHGRPLLSPENGAKTMLWMEVRSGSAVNTSTGVLTALQSYKGLIGLEPYIDHTEQYVVSVLQVGPTTR